MSVKAGRFASFDLVKGMLILLVIIGHMIPENFNDHPVKRFIYLFHMPLFLGLTGFFVSRKTIDLDVAQILSKYWPTLLKPFLLAFVVFTALNLLVLSDQADLRTVWRSFLYPFFHLWYVPAVMLFIIYTALLKSFNVYLTLAIAFTLTSLHAVSAGAIFNHYEWMEFVGDKRFYGYYFYFLLGFVLAKRSLNNPLAWLVLFLPALCVLLLSEHTVANGLALVIGNAALIGLVLFWCNGPARKRIQANAISEIGRVSLPIYLWHVLPLGAFQLVYGWTGFSKQAGERGFFYLALALLMLAFVALVLKMENRFAIFDRWIYGERKVNKADTAR